MLDGGGGGKAVDQGEHAPIARSPDAEPGACVAWIVACASNASGISGSPSSASVSRYAILRQTPEVGAVCGKSARTDLRGGCRVTGIPTAIRREMERPWLLADASTLRTRVMIRSQSDGLSLGVRVLTARPGADRRLYRAPGLPVTIVTICSSIIWARERSCSRVN